VSGNQSPLTRPAIRFDSSAQCASCGAGGITPVIFLREGIGTRLAESLEQALKLAEGAGVSRPGRFPGKEEPFVSSEVEKRAEVGKRGEVEKRVSTSLDTNGEGGKKAVLGANVLDGRIVLPKSSSAPSLSTVTFVSSLVDVVFS
jgi:hypothetical protein